MPGCISDAYAQGGKHSRHGKCDNEYPIQAGILLPGTASDAGDEIKSQKEQGLGSVDKGGFLGREVQQGAGRDKV